MTEQKNEEELVASEKAETEEQTVDTVAQTTSKEPEEPSGCCGSCS